MLYTFFLKTEQLGRLREFNHFLHQRRNHNHVVFVYMLFGNQKY